MTGDPLDVLVGKLSSGDMTVAEQAFRAYEPYLRMVVRRQLPSRLRSKFDSTDIVQSVWADVLSRFRDADYRFADAAHLRAFLVKATRNRFIDRLRQHQRPLQREQSLEITDYEELPIAQQPRPSEIVRADELWQQMLDGCSPTHREVLRLKREGHDLAEIASRTGLHPSSVRRILYESARRLAGRQREGGALEP